MSTHVRILPSSLVDQIAAGEVVERPASVVKELAENSMDAGAKRIVCRVEQAGSKLIRVVDDGIGMSRSDVELAIKRHATSKIATSDDLNHILTLGFRGEALPSIAAVSRLRIITRRKEDDAATRLVTEGGDKVELSDVGAPVGTEVEVADLFFNVPARRKFLRTQATELSHIQAWLIRLGLAREEVHLRLEHGNRTILDVPAAQDFGQRTAMLLGRDVYEHLHSLRFHDGDLRLSGLLSDPEHSRANARGMIFFINGRYVQDRLLQHAVMESCRAVLPQGRYPTTVLRIDLDPLRVDVNVHPQKTEVRFEQPQQVHHAVGLAVAELFASAPWIKNKRTYLLKTEQTLWFGKNDSKRTGGVHEAMLGYKRRISNRSNWLEPEKKPWFPSDAARAPCHPSFQAVQPLAQCRFVGTLWDTYVLIHDRSKLLVLDQHAAAERIAFEHMLALLNKGRVQSQRLLVPLQVELDNGAVSVLEAQRERIDRFGFDMEPFGSTIVVVKAVPALLAKASLENLVRDILDELVELDLASPWECARLKVIGRMACHASVRAGQALSAAEVQSLLTQLDSIDFSGTCPHGRPVMVDFDRAEVERWFRRG